MNELIKIVIWIVIALVVALIILPWMAVPAPWNMLLKIVLGLIFIAVLIGLAGYSFPWIKK